MAISVVSCRTDTSGKLGSETNWFGDCRHTGACTKGSCLCGICTTACTESASCGGGVCAVSGGSAYTALCDGAADPPNGVCAARCSRPADCQSGMQCSAGACVHATTELPDASMGAAGRSTGGATAATGGAGASSGGASNGAGAGGIAGDIGGAGPAGSGGTSEGAGGAGPLSDAGGAPCNDTRMPSRGVQVVMVTGTAPMRRGGVIVDGLYQLESALVYSGGSDAGVSIEGRAQSIMITGRRWASVSYFDNAPTIRYDDEASFSGNSVTLRRVCGPAYAGILFGSEATFDGESYAFDLRFDHVGGAFGDKTAILTFRRAPDNFETCAAAPCSNSYDCCAPDGGGPPSGVACGASGTCELCGGNGLNDPCLGRPPGDPLGDDCCGGLRCMNNRCIR